DVEVVQVADHPGRTQPGSAEIDFEAFWRALARRDWHGLVELEHGWDVPGLDSEQRGIQTLRRLDALASSAR
ncbi:MAG: xylose isomerase, partial [Rhizobacter sp.]|nr:xylose isomerase [Rhizobacter sp.]